MEEIHYYISNYISYQKEITQNSFKVCDLVIEISLKGVVLGNFTVFSLSQSQKVIKVFTQTF